MEEIKKEKQKFFHNNVLFFMLLIFLTIIVSWLGSLLNWQATYGRINPIIGKLEGTVVAVENLLSVDGIRYIFGNAITNFITFTPLGLIIISLIGIGMAYYSGLLTVIFQFIGKKLTKFWLTFLVVIIGIISNFVGDMGYVILIPLSAIFFLVNNRNPIIGIIVSFVSIAAGYGINFVATNLDYSLTPYTRLASALVVDNYNLSLYSNIFFTITTTIILAFFITYITEKFIITKVPKYRHDDNFLLEEVVINKKVLRGLVLAGLGFIIVSLIFIYLLIPGLPSSGLLLDINETTYLGKLFGSNSYFSQSIIYMIVLLMIICGWLYGLGARTIKNKKQFNEALYSNLNNIGPLLLLIFLASQFINLFRTSNIGIVVTVWLGDFINALAFTSIPLIILFFLAVGISNLLLTSSVTKWSILSPIIIPVFMKTNITPEFTQAIYRVSDSVTNIITPALIYFVIFIGFIEIYTKSENKASIFYYYKILLIYSLAILGLWLFVLVAWYILGLPIGVNVWPTA